VILLYCQQLNCYCLTLSTTGQLFYYIVNNWTTNLLYCQQLDYYFTILSTTGLLFYYIVNNWTAILLYCQQLDYYFTILSTTGLLVYYIVNNWTAIFMTLFQAALLTTYYQSYLFHCSLIIKCLQYTALCS